MMNENTNKVNVISVQIRPKIGRREENHRKVKEFIDANSHLNPDLILMPEFFNSGVSVVEFKKLAEDEKSSETLAFFSKIAKEYRSYILTGSIIEKVKEQDSEKFYNTSWLLNRNGEVIAKYRKMHLFDSFGGTENQYNTPGDEYVVADTDFGKVGMSVCFDIKFPKHYIELVKRGAEVIVEPAAWCAPNNILENAKEEWILMNRARALDNMVYFVSSNQCGKIDSFLSACGHSIIAAPNGKILSDAGDDEGIAAFQIDMEFLRLLRTQFDVNKLAE